MSFLDVPALLERSQPRANHARIWYAAGLFLLVVLGSAYAPFVPDGEGNFQRDLRLGLPRERFDDRRALLTGLDRLKRARDSGSSGAAV